MTARGLNTSTASSASSESGFCGDDLDTPVLRKVCCVYVFGLSFASHFEKDLTYWIFTVLGVTHYLRM